jgi:hypothetical protein
MNGDCGFGGAITPRTPKTAICDRLTAFGTDEFYAKASDL